MWVLNVWKNNHRLVSLSSNTVFNCRLPSHLKAISIAFCKMSFWTSLDNDFCHTKHVILRTHFHSNITCPFPGHRGWGPDVGADFESVKTHLKNFMAEGLEWLVSLWGTAELNVLPVKNTSKRTGAPNDRPMHVWVPQLAELIILTKKTAQADYQATNACKAIPEKTQNKINRLHCTDICTTVFPYWWTIGGHPCDLV